MAEQASGAMLQWQYRKIMGELLLTQAHSSDLSCPCELSSEYEYCLPKHLIALQSYAEETMAMVEDGEAKEVLQSIAGGANDLRRAYEEAKKEEERPYADITEFARQNRKALEPYLFKYKEVSPAEVGLADPINIPSFIDELNKLAPNGGVYKGVRFSHTIDPRGVVDINRFEALEPRKGSGTIVLNEFIDLADRYGVPLRLQVAQVYDPSLGFMDREQLMSWYEKFGFQFDKTPGANYGVGVRQPKPLIVGLAEFVRAREAELAEGLGSVVITGLAKFIKKQEVAKMGADIEQIFIDQLGLFHAYAKGLMEATEKRDAKEYKRILDKASHLLETSRLKEVAKMENKSRGREFKDKQAFLQAVAGFNTAIGSGMVVAEPEKIEFETHEKATYWSYVFNVQMRVDDPNLDVETYNKGEAHIYLSDAFYDKVSKAGHKYFGMEVGWNNTRTTGWFNSITLAEAKMGATNTRRNYYCAIEERHPHKEIIQIETLQKNPKCPYCGGIMTYGRYWGALPQAEEAEMGELKDLIEVSLPFAGASKDKLWWLATIRDKIHQVEVSGVRLKGLKDWEVEEAFANSMAVVSVPTDTLAKMGAREPREIPIKWDNTEYGLRAEVYPISGDDSVRITIARNKKYGSPELGKAEVNWQALGSQSVEITKEFAEGLLYARAVAQAMEGRVYLYSVSYERDGAVMQTSVMGNNEEQVRLGLPPELEVKSIVKGEQVASAIVAEEAPYARQIPKAIEVFKTTIHKHYRSPSAFHKGSIRTLKPKPDILVTMGCLKKDDWDAKSVTCAPNPTVMSTVVPKTKEYLDELEHLKLVHPKIKVEYRTKEVGIEPRVGEDGELDEVIKAMGKAEVIK